MHIDAIQLVYFSPTGTTKRIVEGIAAAFQDVHIRRLDLTRPGNADCDFEAILEGLTIIGAPVYAGRIPAEAERRFRRLKSKGSPAIIVVVYGNREFEDALLELSDIAVVTGFKPVGGGTFIGEHSFSSSGMPIAGGRPDNADIERALEFGTAIKKKLETIKKAGDLKELRIPGNYPYKERMDFPPTTPVWNGESCIFCAACVAGCPTEAITISDVIATDSQMCILCCACVKFCPTRSRIFEDKMVKTITAWLYENCSRRKEPQTYI